MTNANATLSWGTPTVPTSASLGVRTLRALPMPVRSEVPGHGCVPTRPAPAQKSVLVAGVGDATADAAVIEDTFPGTSAWSPPI